MAEFSSGTENYETPLSARIPEYATDPAGNQGVFAAIGASADLPETSPWNIARAKQEVSTEADPAQALAAVYAAAGVTDPEQYQKLADMPKPDFGPPVKKDDLDKRYAPPGEKWFDHDMPDHLAQIVAKQKTQEMERRGVWQRFTNQHSWPVNFGAGMVAFLMDPLNAATMFVPGIGEERAAAAIAAIGLREGLAARMATRGVAGATAGAAGMVPIEALRAAGDPEFELRQSFKDMAFGATVGALLHSGLSVPGELKAAYAARKIKALGPAPEAQATVEPEAGVYVPPRAETPDPHIAAQTAQIINSDLETKHAAISTAVSQVVRGEPVNVEPVFASPALVVARKTPSGVRYGQPGQVHSDLMTTQELAASSDAPEVANSMGYATRDGQFLTRADALAFAQKNEPARAAWSAQQPQFGLDAATYNEAMQPRETPAELAQHQTQLHKEGFSPATTQDEVRQQEDAIYGRSDQPAAPAKRAAPADTGAAAPGQAAGSSKGGTTAQGTLPAGGPRPGEAGAAGATPAGAPETVARAELPEIQRHGAEAGSALVHDPAIEAILARPEVQADVQRPRAIDRTKDVPYLAGSNQEGGVTYIDRRVPHEIEIDGKTVDPAKYLNVHEQTEHALMEEGGMPYETAHRVATIKEQAAVEADGIDWAAYQKEMGKFDRITEPEAATEPPSDLYTKGVYSPAEAAKLEAASKKTFTVANGSTYEAHGDRTTTRTKAPRAEPGLEADGPMPQSEATIYLLPKEAEKLSKIQKRGADRIIAPMDDGRWGVKDASGKFMRTSIVTPKLSPEPGHVPVETWGGGASHHVGNEIIDVQDAAPTPAAEAPAAPVKPMRKPTVPKRPLSMINYIGRNGGLEATPDAKAAGFHRHPVPGNGSLARANGRSLDSFWRERLMEEGYIPRDPDDQPPRDVKDEIFQLLDDEIRHKRPTYSIRDQAEVQRLQDEKQIAHDPDVQQHHQETIAKLSEQVRQEAKERDMGSIDDAVVGEAADMLFNDATLHPADAIERAFELIALQRGHPVEHVYGEHPEAWEDETYRGAASEHGALSGEEGGGGDTSRPQERVVEPGSHRSDALEMGRFRPEEEGSGGSESTPAGEQQLIPGVAPLKPKTQTELIQQEAAAPLKGGAAEMPKGGLFDEMATQQTDLLDAIAKAEQALKGVTLDRATLEQLAAVDHKLADAEREAAAYREAGMCLEEGL